MDPEVKALLEQTTAALKQANELLVQTRGWQSDLTELQKQVQENAKRNDPVDTEKLETGIRDVIEAKFAEERASGLLSRQARDKVLSDPWSPDISYLETMSVTPKNLTDATDKKQFIHTLDVLQAAEPKDDCHKMWARMGFDVKIADAYSRAMYKRESREYPGFGAACPNIAKAWSETCRQYVEHYTGKAALDPMDLTDMAYWVPTGWATEVRDIITIQLVVAALFERFRMPQSPFKFPLNLTDTTGNYIPETTAYTDPYAASDPTQLGQNLTDGEATFTAKKLRGRLMTSGELDEDAIVAMLPLMRKQVEKILANSEENAVYNGDTAAAGSTLDDDITAYDARAALVGIRKWAQTATSMVDAGGTLTTAQLVSTVRKTMGEYGVDTGGNLVWICGPSSYLRCLGLAEFLTVDKYGPAATVLQGELGRIGGLPFVVSRYNREDLETTGLYLAAGTKGSTIMTLVRKDAWMIGDKREVTLEVDRLAPTDQYDVIGMTRLDFQNMFGTSYKTGAVLRNIPN